MALYYPPVKPNAPIYSYQNFAAPNIPVSSGGTGTITEEFLATHYLQFPNAQGVENFGFQELNLTSTNIGENASLYINPAIGEDVVLQSSVSNGSLSIKTSATTNNTMILSPSTGLTFGDGTTQTTAYNDNNTVQTDQVNTFQAGFLQTFNGPVNLNGATNGVTAPLGDSSTLLATTKFVIDNSDPAPILTNYAQKTLATLQTFTGPITFNQSPTTIGLSLLNASLDYLIQPRTNYGLVVINNGGNGTLALSDGGSKVASITCTASQNFDFNGASLEDIPSINIGSQSVYASFQTNPANGITTLTNNNVSGGFTYNVNGGPIPTICNMLGTGFYIYNTLDMTDNSITGIDTLSGNLSSAISVSSPISMNSGNAININNSTLNLYSGTISTNIGQSIGQVYFNNTTPFANSPSFSFALYKSGGFSSVLDLSPTSVALTTQLNMNNQNIINCNSITDTSGQFVTTNTPPDNTITTAIATTGYVATAISNIPPPSLSGYAKLAQGGVQQWSGSNTCSTGTWDFQNGASVLVQTVANSTNNNTVASTAFVKANAGVYTQTSMTMTSSVYVSLTPSTVNVITTYTSANNVVSFNSVQFVITIGTPPTFLLATLNFSASPFPGAPPSTTQQAISMYCSNGATYTGQINWISATSMYIGISGGPNLTSGMTFTCNLANLGAFTP